MAYDLKKCNIILDGDHMVTGYGAGNPISIAFNSDAITPYIGAKGETAVAINNDDTAQLTLVLAQNSSSVSVLDDYASGRTNFSMSFVDKNDEGNIKADCEDCFVQTRPTKARGSEVGEETFVIYIPKLNYK